MFSKNYFFLSLFLLAILQCLSKQMIAQEYPPCGTDIMYKKALERHPEYAQRQQQKITSYKTAAPPETLIIPTVVHIMYSDENSKVSKAQVLDAIRIVNEDFQKRNPDTANVVPAFKSLIGNALFELRLANIDPEGKCTDGITYTYTPLSNNADDNVKALIQWEPTQYLNIWVVNKISFGAGGFAYYPGSVPPELDGIVILRMQFGSIGFSNGTNAAKTSLSHEVGHYFDLVHTWGERVEVGDPNACFDSDGDYVNDTPVTNGAPLNCNLNQMGCGVLANVNNFMDYSTCASMFTKGQVTRMRNAAQWWRDVLYSNSNLAATGTAGLPQLCVPKVAFKTNRKIICAGKSVTFTDECTNAKPILWKWSFPGGTPGSSTDSVPVITYTTPGNYSVKLVAGNTAGNDSIIVNHIITVRSDAAKYPSPYLESFENAGLSNADWEISNPDNDVGKWEITGAAATTGNFSARMNAFSADTSLTDEFISPTFDLSTISNPSLFFKVAAAQYSATSDFRLQLLMTNNCGETWLVRYLKVGASLATAGGYVTTNFIPNPTQWRQEKVNIPSTFIGSKTVQCKFRFINGRDTCNNVYIDDINVSGPNGIDDDYSSSLKISASPNPYSGYTRISYELPIPGMVTLEIYNMVGQKIHTAIKQVFAPGNYDYLFSAHEFGHAPGIYIVKLQAGDATVTYKLVEIE